VLSKVLGFFFSQIQSSFVLNETQFFSVCIELWNLKFKHEKTQLWYVLAQRLQNRLFFKHDIFYITVHNILYTSAYSCNPDCLFLNILYVWILLNERAYEIRTKVFFISKHLWDEKSN
jgi:hypothetical protein